MTIPLTWLVSLLVLWMSISSGAAGPSPTQSPVASFQVSTPRQDVVRLCQQLFGKRITPTRKPGDPDVEVFEIDPLYALAVTFGESGQLRRLEVNWKSRLSIDYPQWEDPPAEREAFLSTSQYEQLLSMLDGVRPKGKLIRKQTGIGFVTNSTARMKDEYEHATVERGEIMDVRRPVDAPTLIWWMQITNFH